MFALYLAEEKIEPEVVENMRTWPHSGFSVDQSVYLPAGDRAGIERLIGYMTRCPFSLSRLVKVTETGQVIYKAEKDACRAFPDRKTTNWHGAPSGTSRSSTRWISWPNSPQTYSAAGRTPDPRAPTEGWSRLVLEQGPGNATQGRRGRGSRSRRGGTGGRVVERRRRTGSGPQSLEPDLGHAHQAAVRDRPVGLS